MSKNDGGPAFPSTFQNFKGDYVRDSGMSLRDYIAIKVAPDMLSWGRGFNASSERIATQCYTFADAMLKAQQEES